jgi:hypothetical protein
MICMRMADPKWLELAGIEGHIPSTSIEAERMSVLERSREFVWSGRTLTSDARWMAIIGLDAGNSPAVPLQAIQTCLQCLFSYLGAGYDLITLALAVYFFLLRARLA